MTAMLSARDTVILFGCVCLAALLFSLVGLTWIWFGDRREEWDQRSEHDRFRDALARHRYAKGLDDEARFK